MNTSFMIRFQMTQVKDQLQEQYEKANEDVRSFLLAASQ